MAQELIIRPASEGDSAGIFAIDHVAAKSERRRQFIRNAIKDHCCFVASEKSQIVGFGILQYTFFDCGFIPSFTSRHRIAGGASHRSSSVTWKGFA